MRSLPMLAAAFVTCALISSACSADESLTSPSTAAPSFLIQDGLHGGTLGFYFLSPIVDKSKLPKIFPGTFDPTGLNPIVRICLASVPDCGASVFSLAAPKVDPAQEKYFVNWKTPTPKQRPLATYRIHILAGAAGYERELGVADVKLTGTGADANKATSDQQLGWVAGNTLTISFRIEKGIVGAVTVSPATTSIFVGATQSFTATVRDLHGAPLGDTLVSWTAVPSGVVASLEPTSGSTDGSGQTMTTVTAGLTPGTAMVTAGSQAISGTATLTVNALEFASVSSGLYHSCAPLKGGTAAHCWGDNGFGQAPSIRLPPTGTTFTLVSAGAFHNCALLSDGKVSCWGYNFYGNAPPEIQVAPSGTFTQVSAGGNHTCALVSDGSFRCWGQESYGETPVSQVPGPDETFTQVSAGGTQTCVLKDVGTVVGRVGCWGDQTYGQAPASRDPPPNTHYTQLSAGYFHTCALVSDGTVDCWGGNFYGEAPITPTVPPQGLTFTQVSATLYHTCALVSDGTVRCWGNNADGFAPPIQVAPSGTFTQVSAAFTHQCALMSDGNVGCWGGMIGQTIGFHVFTP